ncbi:5'-3' exonuclease [Burkholderia ambifaria]|uniref:5'-3' exonuclease n=1 Tax=Burkholderia ambifaria TaxID=152480 RepID=UPI000F80F33A|nr:5'-3' exonuclease H3TH domain-containing protein [Burkholderia ambifaria]
MPAIKLLAIDGHYLVRRIHSVQPAEDAREKAAGAIETLHYSVLRALREHRPTHCLFAFDAGVPTWRHALYPPYKANRQPMPAELQEELARYKARLAQEGWAQAEHPGHEADDTLASVAFAALALDAEVVVLATDKDIACLSQYGAKVYDHFGHEWHDFAWCQAKFGVGPERLQDWLALVGDTVDGVPGVEGVGVKNATKLLLEHGDLEGVLTAAAGMKGKLGENLRDQADVARLSRRLTALRLDLFPHGLNADALRVPRSSQL